MHRELPLARATAALPLGQKAPAVWQLHRYNRSPLPFLGHCAHRNGDPFTGQLAGYGALVILTAADAVSF